MNDKLLIEKAKEALTFSYAPYSGFHVAAALLSKSGKVYTGCNIENASYGATNCAERTAFFKAISEGEREFLKIAIVSKSNNPEFSEFSGDYTYPCGICVQVMVEHMPKGEVILSNKDDIIKIIKVSELAPFSFTV